MVEMGFPNTPPQLQAGQQPPAPGCPIPRQTASRQGDLPAGDSAQNASASPAKVGTQEAQGSPAQGECLVWFYEGMELELLGVARPFAWERLCPRSFALAVSLAPAALHQQVD